MKFMHIGLCSFNQKFKSNIQPWNFNPKCYITVSEIPMFECRGKLIYRLSVSVSVLLVLLLVLLLLTQILAQVLVLLT